MTPLRCSSDLPVFCLLQTMLVQLGVSLVQRNWTSKLLSIHSISLQMFSSLLSKLSLQPAHWLSSFGARPERNKSKDAVQSELSGFDNQYSTSIFDKWAHSVLIESVKTIMNKPPTCRLYRYRAVWRNGPGGMTANDCADDTFHIKSHPLPSHQKTRNLMCR